MRLAGLWRHSNTLYTTADRPAPLIGLIGNAPAPNDDHDFYQSHLQPRSQPLLGAANRVHKLHQIIVPDTVAKHRKDKICRITKEIGTVLAAILGVFTFLFVLLHTITRIKPSGEGLLRILGSPFLGVGVFIALFFVTLLLIGAIKFFFWINLYRTLSRRLSSYDSENKLRESQEFHEEANDSNTPRHESYNGEPKPYQDHIIKAMHSLGITGDLTETKLKQSYLNSIKEYHPDKVASLGKELRDLAEMKAKEINAAYQTLKTHLYK